MKKTFNNGKTYVSCDVLSFGDYDNSCAVERANVRVLQEAHPGFESYSMSDWDMLQHRDATGQGITADEAREILMYAAELERQIETVKP